MLRLNTTQIHNLKLQIAKFKNSKIAIRLVIHLNLIIQKNFNYLK